MSVLESLGRNETPWQLEHNTFVRHVY